MREIHGNRLEIHLLSLLTFFYDIFDILIEFKEKQSREQLMYIYPIETLLLGELTEDST